MVAREEIAPQRHTPTLLTMSLHRPMVYAELVNEAVTLTRVTGSPIAAISGVA